MKRRSTARILVFDLLILLAALSLARPSHAGMRIDLSGRLTRTSGAPVLRGIFEVHSELWDSSVPPRLLWFSRDTLVARNGNYWLEIGRWRRIELAGSRDTIKLVLSFCPTDSIARVLKLPAAIGARLRYRDSVDIATDAPPSNVLSERLRIQVRGSAEAREFRFMAADRDSLTLAGFDQGNLATLALAELESVQYVAHTHDLGIRQGVIGFVVGGVFGAGFGYAIGQSDAGSDDVGRMTRGGVVGGVVGAILGFTRGRKSRSIEWQSISVPELREAINCRLGSP